MNGFRKGTPSIFYHSWLFRLVLLLFLTACIIVVWMWARASDPFKQIELSLKAADGGAFKCLMVLPKPMGKHPVVIYLEGACGGPRDGKQELQQFAELGLAAVSLKYDQMNQSVFNEQFVTLRYYLQQQSWAQSNATAWVGFGLGAQRTLAFARQHAEMPPQLLACLGGGWSKELESLEFPTANQLDPSTHSLQLATSFHFRVLLVDGERGDGSPVGEVQRLAEWLRSKDAVVETHNLPKLAHDFGTDRGVVMRAVAEYCAARLAPPDYTDDLTGCQLNEANRTRFNRAMQRAGQRRQELWRAVTAAREPERDTMMNVIGGLEDYDLAHISAAQLKECVYSAWLARRKYPWCRDTPLEIFDRFVVNPRIYEEPLEDWSDPYGPTLSRMVKYCHTTAEASDALWGWMRVRAIKNTTSIMDRPEEVLSRIRGGCFGFSIAFTGLGRTVGLPVRPAWTFWPMLGNDHYWNEVWSVEEKQWHAFDASALNRPYNADWVTRVPKSVIQVPTGERGAWNAIADKRWESMTNSIGLFYPSGRVLVQVLDGVEPAPGRRVGVQVWLGNGMGGELKIWEPEVFMIAAAITDQKGEARLVLGQSDQQPYRIFLDSRGESDWQWLAVRSNRTYMVTLETGNQKPFDIKMTPPPLGRLEDETLQTQ